jgi:hypothetical protein
MKETTKGNYTVDIFLFYVWQKYYINNSWVFLQGLFSYSILGYKIMWR